jgi:integrase
MSRKRRTQKGSLKKLLNRDGRLWWRLQWRKPGEKNVTTKWLGKASKMSKAAAKAERDRILAPINAGLERPFSSSMMTLSDFIDNVFVKLKRETKRWREDSTEPTNLQILDDHLKAPLGSKLIHLITRKELQDLLIAKANKGCSYSLVQHVHSFLGEIFEMALADGLLSLNPARTVVIPKCKPPKPKVTLTPEDIDRVEKALDIRERLIFRLDTVEGVRPSEWSGLQVGDAESDRVHIARRNYRFHVDDPKNFRSWRVVHLHRKRLRSSRNTGSFWLRTVREDGFSHQRIRKVHWTIAMCSDGTSSRPYKGAASPKSIIEP